MGWLVVAIVAAALGLALFSAQRWVQTRLDPTLDDVRRASGEARGVPVTAWVEDGAVMDAQVAGERWLSLGCPHVLVAPSGAAARVAAELLRSEVLVLVLSQPDALDLRVALDVAGTRSRAPGRLFTVEQPSVRWSVPACALTLPAGEAVVVVALQDGAPGDVLAQAARASERTGCASIVVAHGAHAQALVAEMGRLGHPGRVRSLFESGLAESG